MVSENDSPTDDLQQRVEELADGFVENLRRGEPESKQQLIEDHPELAPFLENRLNLIEAVYRATNLSSPNSSVQGEATKKRAGRSPRAQNKSLGGDESFDLAGNPRSMRVRCPHCGNAVQLATQRTDQATCESCGSVVNIDEDLTRTDCSASIPKKIGRFEVVRILGQGAFGLVYLANDPELERPVAIKVPRKGFFSSTEEEQRFFREASSSAQLRHPNIVQVHEISQIDGIPFIVSEFINGVTLKDLASSGLLSFKDIAKLMIQIADAVHHAHANGVVHRDLKPSNILIDHHRSPYVADFGLARRDDAEITVTLDGTILGTPAYMSPEQAVGDHDLVDARSDVYSLGVVLYRLLSRELPFNGTKRTLLHQVINEEPSRPSKYNDRIPKDLDTITLKAMQKKPLKRYQSAKELGNELQRWLLGEPIKARPISSIERFGRWCRRYPTIASLTCTILGLLTLSAIGGLIAAKIQHDLRFQSDANASRAIEKETESNSRLHQLLQQNSSIALSDNRLIEAAFWQAKANEISDAPETTALNMLIDQLPKQSGHWEFKSRPRGIECSQDGQRIATHTDDGTVQVIDRQTGHVICMIPTNIDYSSHFRFLTPNRIVLRSENSKVQVWDIESVSLIRQIDFEGLINAFDVNPEKERFAIGTLSSEAVVFDIDGRELGRFSEEDWQVLETKFLGPDKLFVRVNKAGVNGEKIYLWEWANEASTKVIEIESRVVSTTLSPSRSKLATSSIGSLIQIWNTSDGKESNDSINGKHVVRHLRFLNEDRIIGIDDAGNVDQWDTSSGDFKHLFDLGEQPDSVAFGENNNLIATAENSGVVRVYLRDFGVEVCSAFSGTANRPALRFAPNGRELLIEGQNNDLSVWDLAGSVPSQTVFEHKAPVRDGVFSPDGKRCVSVSTDGQILLIDAEKLKSINTKLMHDGGVLDCATSPDGLMFATAGAKSTAIVWDFFSGEQIGQPIQHESPVTTLSFSPDSKKLVTGCLNGTVREWTLGSRPGDLKFNFELKHDNRIRRVAYSQSGNYVLSGSLDGVAKCTNVATGLPAYAPCDCSQPLWDCAFFPDEKRIVVSGSYGKVAIWNLEEAKVEQNLDCDGDVKRVFVLDDGTIQTHDSSGMLKSWHQNGDQYSFRTFETADIPSVYHSSIDGVHKFCVTAGGKIGTKTNVPHAGSVTVWDFEQGKQIAPSLWHDRPVRRVAINHSGTRLLSSSEDGMARLVNLAPFELTTEDALLVMASCYANDDLNKPTSTYIQSRNRLPEFFQSEAAEITDWNKLLERWK